MDLGTVTVLAVIIVLAIVIAFYEPDTGGNSYQPGAGREFFGGRGAV